MVKQPTVDVDRPFKLVTVPARFSLIIATAAAISGLLWLFGGQISVKATATGVMVNPPGNVEVFSDVSGTVGNTLVETGTHVKRGDVLATLSTPDGGMFEVTAPIDGKVVSLSTVPFALIGAGAPVVTLAHNTQPMVALLFVPSVAMGDVVPGLAVEVSPDTTDTTVAGHILGKVAKVDPLPMSIERLSLILGDTGMAQELLDRGPIQEVFVELEQDSDGALGLKWSGDGPLEDDEISSGTAVQAKIVLKNQTPWQAFTGG